jgi:rhamnosyltransferase
VTEKAFEHNSSDRDEARVNGVDRMQVTADQGRRVMAIVVTLDSDVHELTTNLAECSECMQVVLCDNSEGEASRTAIRTFAESRDISYFSMDGNRGIGYAQNRGITYAEQAGAEFVLLLDDDSRFSCRALSRLLDAYRDLQLGGDCIGAVCGRPVDRHHAGSSDPDKTSNPIQCREMMSSGSLIPIAVLHDVGFMDESLFVDYVDFEWGWRAIAHGYTIYLAADVSFSHALGDGIQTVAGMKIKLKSPIRHYYQTRNALRLLRRPYVPMIWKIKNFVMTLVKCMVFPIFVPPRSQRALYVVRGLKDGVWGTGSGCYPPR